MSIKEAIQDLWLTNLAVYRPSVDGTYNSYRLVDNYRERMAGYNLIYTPVINDNIVEIPDAIFNNHRNQELIKKLNRTLVFPINISSWDVNYKGFVSFVRNIIRGGGVHKVKFNDVSYYGNSYIILNQQFEPIFYSTTTFKIIRDDLTVIKQTIYLTDILFNNRGPLENVLASHAVDSFTGIHGNIPIEVVCGRNQNLVFTTEPLDAFTDSKDLSDSLSKMFAEFSKTLDGLPTERQYERITRLGS